MQVVHVIRGTDMKEYISSVSPKGQITIPAEIRELLGIKPKDKVIFEMGEERVKIRPLAARLEASYQAIPALTPARTLEEMMEIAHEDHAQEAAQEGL